MKGLIMSDKIVQMILVLLNLVFVIFLYNFIDFIHRGGFFIIPMMFCSFLSFAIIFSKLNQLNSESIDTNDFLAKIYESMERQRIKEALELCEQRASSVSRVLKSGIMKYDRPKDEIKEAMEEAFMYEGPMLEGRLSLLSTMIQIIPLMGLLGTLVAFMKILVVIQSKSLSLLGIPITDVAPGIWEALVCSVAGFLIVIPLYIAYNYFLYRIKSMNEEMERTASEFLSFLMERRMPL